MPTVDQYSAVPVPLWLVGNGQQLGRATGFFHSCKGKNYLVSNWHVFSGRHPSTGQPIHHAGGIPDTVELWMHAAGEHGGYQGYRKDPRFTLNDASGGPRWFQHPEKGQDVDVAVIEFDSIPEGAVVYDAVRPDEKEKLAFRVGMDVFVLGYPAGLTAR